MGLRRWIVADGAGNVDDDIGDGFFVFAGDFGEGAGKLLKDVGQDGGALGGDTVFGQEAEEVGEDEVDVGGGFDVLEFAEEFAFEVGKVGVFEVKGEVGGAEGGGVVLDGETAASTREGAMLAGGRVVVILVLLAMSFILVLDE